MKKVSIAAAILVLSVSLFQSAEANDRGLNRVIIGGGSGAIVGQAIGRNTEATIIGATVGGVLGLLVGSDINRQHVYVNTYQPASRYYHHPYRGWSRSYHRPQQHCERIIKIRKGRHFERRVVKTVCRDRSRFDDHKYRPVRHDRWHR